MARQFTAQVSEFVQKTENALTFVIREATQAMMQDATETVSGVSRGTPFVRGMIPVDTGALAASLSSSLNGAQVAQGEDSYIASIQGMEAGDSAQFIWGNDVDYAVHVHYGTANMPGRFWVEDAIVNWQAYVDAAAKRAQDIVG